MRKINSVAKVMVDYLEENGNDDPDWYYTAIYEVDIFDLFDEDLTEKRDPGGTSTSFVFSDNDLIIEVFYSPKDQEWDYRELNDSDFD